MKKNSLVICDQDEKYCKKLDSFLRDYLSVPFEISEYTNTKYLRAFEDKKNSLLIISEKLFDIEVIEGFKNVLVLEELPVGVSEKDNTFGVSDDVNLKFTGKYQSAERLSESILSMFLDMPGVIITGKRIGTGEKMKLIAFYTPVKSILQTRITLDFAKNLSSYEKCIFVTNDPFCCEQEIRAGDYDENISDLMYYSECEPEKFSIYLEKVARRSGSLDYIPSADGQIRDAGATDYLRLFQKMEESGKYKVMIFDIAEQMRSLTEVFKACDILIVLTGAGKYSDEKLSIFMRELENTEGFDMEKFINADTNRIGEVMRTIQKEMQKEKNFEKG
jgi:hypothetical protein